MTNRHCFPWKLSTNAEKLGECKEEPQVGPSTISCLHAMSDKNSPGTFYGGKELTSLFVACQKPEYIAPRLSLESFYAEGATTDF